MARSFILTIFATLALSGLVISAPVAQPQSDPIFADIVPVKAVSGVLSPYQRSTIPESIAARSPQNDNLLLDTVPVKGVAGVITPYKRGVEIEERDFEANLDERDLEEFDERDLSEEELEARGC